MTEYEKTEQAYKNGYAKGFEDGKKSVEVVHGRWEYHGGDDDLNLYGFCSNCHKSWDEDVMEKFNYCPNCGAKMVLEV